MINKHPLLVTAFAGLILTAGASTAFAECSSGFLANLACEAGVIDKQTANGLDAAHAAADRPLDHAANAAAGAAVGYVAGPAAGAYVTQGLEMRDAYNRGRLPW